MAGSTSVMVRTGRSNGSQRSGRSLQQAETSLRNKMPSVMVPDIDSAD
jgi:hypothetical protein